MIQQIIQKFWDFFLLLHLYELNSSKKKIYNWS